MSPLKAYLKSVATKCGFLNTYYNLFPQKPLHVESIADYIRLSRWFMYLKMRARMVFFLALRKLKIEILDYSNDRSHLVHVIHHNLHNDYLTSRFSRRRSEHLIYLLKSIPSVNRRGKVLSIGPKNEGELLLFQGHGFPNVQGIDLFSYSPLIRVMDMHETEFADGSFDVICAGYVLRYSYDIRKCANEILRIAKDGAHIAVSFSMKREGPEGLASGSLLYGGIDELLGYFQPRVKYVYWRLEDKNTDEYELPEHTYSTIFSINK